MTGMQRRPAQEGISHKAGWQHTGTQQFGLQEQAWPQATGHQGAMQPQACWQELAVLTPGPHSRTAQGTQQKAPWPGRGQEPGARPGRGHEPGAQPGAAVELLMGLMVARAWGRAAASSLVCSHPGNTPTLCAAIADFTSCAGRSVKPVPQGNPDAECSL